LLVDVAEDVAALLVARIWSAAWCASPVSFMRSRRHQDLVKRHDLQGKMPGNGKFAPAFTCFFRKNWLRWFRGCGDWHSEVRGFAHASMKGSGRNTLLFPYKTRL
jgi:hypothetical protein